MNQGGNRVGAKREVGLGGRLSSTEEFCTGAVLRVMGLLKIPSQGELCTGDSG